MALTMVHLLAARLWAARRPQYLNDPEYYLGAISPDAIHVRDHGDKSHKDEIHLHNWQSPHPDDVIAYWRGHAAPFDIGYGVHVLTDAQWVPRYRERLRGMMPDGRLDKSRYYNDTWMTDFALLRTHPELEAMLGLIAVARVPENHPLLTAYEFDEWRRLTVETYRGECPKNDRVRFVTVDYVMDFIRDTPDLIDRVYREAFGEE